MDRIDLLKKVQETFREVLNNDDIVLVESMGPSDVDEWNSLAQVQLLTELEHEFDIRFSLMELMSINTVGDIIEALLAHLSESK